MAKDKSLKSKPPKRKDSGEIMDSKVNAKRKKVDVDEAPAQMPHLTNTTDGKKQKKNKKHKKQQVNQVTEQSKQTEILESPSCPKGTAELEGLEDLSPEEKRVLERKLKKVRKKEEKKRLKEEGMTLQKTNPPGPSAEQQALDYLTCWAENRSQWKFQKTRQTWLLQHMFDSEKIPDEKYSVLLQYLEGLRGSGRDTTVQKALFLVEESGKAPEDIVVQQRAHRAREVIQLLS